MNVSQLQSEVTKSNAMGRDMASALGGGSTYDSTTGNVSAPTYNVGGTTVNSVGDAVTNIDNRVTANTTSIANITGDITSISNNLNDGTIGLVQQDSTTKNITVAKDLDGTVVDFSDKDGAARTLAGVKAGALDANSTEAVNGSQLFATNENVAKNAVDIGGLDTRVSQNETSIGGLDTRVSQNETSIGGLDTRVSQNETNIGGLDTRVTNIDSRVTNVEGSVQNITNNLNDGSVGLVQQDSTTKNITVAKDLDGTVVDFSDKDGAARTLAAVKAGALDANSTEAVNGSQLFATNENVAKNAADIGGLDTRVSKNETNIGGLDTRVTNIDSRVTNVEGSVQNIDSRVTNVEGSVQNITNNLNDGSVGLVQQDSTTKNITVAKDLDGTMVDFSDKDGAARTLAGVKAATLDQNSTEAVNGSQLFATNENVAKNAVDIGGLDTRVSQNETNIGGLDTRVTNIDSRVTNVEGSVQNITNNLNDGSVGLVQQDSTTKNITVAKDLDGTVVDFSDKDGAARTLAAVKAGALDANSTEAVNGSQLFATNENVAKNAADIGGLDTRVTSIDSRVTNVEGSVQNITNNLNDGSVGLVQQDSTTKNITVAKDLDGAAVDFSGTAGARVLTGVADGKGEHDAVNVGQLQKTGLLDGNGNALEAVAYDAGSNEGSITFGGANGTQLKNVADGKDEHDAVNVGQLQKAGLVDGAGNTLDAVTYDADSNRGKVTFGDAGASTVLLSNVGAGIANTDAVNVGQLRGLASGLGGGAGIDANGNVIAPTYIVNDNTYNSVGDALQGLAGTIGTIGEAKQNVIEKVMINSNAHMATSGDEAQAATASGNNAVAIGAGSSASANNSVALGAGSVSDRANTVSVGSAGNERAITNVAAGIAPTDAVNVQQLQDAQQQSNAYTDSRFNEVKSDVASLRRDSNAAAAGALAAANLPQSVFPGKTMVSAAAGHMDGESAVAVGMSKMAENGRWITKVAGTANTRGKVGVGAGIGFYW